MGGHGKEVLELVLGKLSLPNGVLRHGLGSLSRVPSGLRRGLGSLRDTPAPFGRHLPGGGVPTRGLQLDQRFLGVPSGSLRRVLGSLYTRLNAFEAHT